MWYRVDACCSVSLLSWFLADLTIHIWMRFRMVSRWAYVSIFPAFGLMCRINPTNCSFCHFIASFFIFTQTSSAPKAATMQLHKQFQKQKFYHSCLYIFFLVFNHERLKGLGWRLRMVGLLWPWYQEAFGTGWGGRGVVWDMEESELWEWEKVKYWTN